MATTDIEYAQTLQQRARFKITTRFNTICLKMNYVEAINLAEFIMSFPVDDIPDRVKINVDSNGEVELSKEMMISLYGALITYQAEHDIGHLMRLNETVN